MGNQLDGKLKDFLSMEQNQFEFMPLIPQELNPFLRCLEALGRTCFVVSRRIISNEGPSYMYMVFPKTENDRRTEYGKVTALCQIDNPALTGQPSLGEPDTPQAIF